LRVLVILNSLSRIIIAFLIYMISMYMAIMIIPPALGSSPALYIRPYQLMVFSNIAILILFTIAYLALGSKLLNYTIQIALASLAITYYLDIAYRISQGIEIIIYPLFTLIKDSQGSSLSIDLAQISIIALVLINIRDKIRRIRRKGLDQSSSTTSIISNTSNTRSKAESNHCLERLNHSSSERFMPFHIY
jgi:hypothetical protein